MAGYLLTPLSGFTVSFTPVVLSTSGTPTTLHTTDATLIDQIWLWGINNSPSVPHLVTLTLGGIAIQQSIPGQMGPIPLLQGITLSGNGSTGTVMTGYADAGGSVWVTGYAIRVNQ